MQCVGVGSIAANADETQVGPEGSLVLQWHTSMFGSITRCHVASARNSAQTRNTKSKLTINRFFLLPQETSVQPMTECAGVVLSLSTAEPTVKGTPPTLGNKTVSLKPEGLEVAAVEMGGVEMADPAQRTDVMLKRRVSCGVSCFLTFSAIKLVGTPVICSSYELEEKQHLGPMHLVTPLCCHVFVPAFEPLSSFEKNS